MKKILAVLIALVMLASMSGFAMAEEPMKIGYLLSDLSTSSLPPLRRALKPNARSLALKWSAMIPATTPPMT